MFCWARLLQNTVTWRIDQDMSLPAMIFVEGEPWSSLFVGGSQVMSTSHVHKSCPRTGTQDAAVERPDAAAERHGLEMEDKKEDAPASGHPKWNQCGLGVCRGM